MHESVTSVSEVMEYIGSYRIYEMMYRGQSQDWPLVPGIGRFDGAGFSHDWRAFHDSVIEEFVRMGNPYFTSSPRSDVEKWVIAQHHGLPTRLLDTALNPLKAIHFAVGDPREDEHDGVLWLINYTGWRENLEDVHRETWDTELTAFLPAQIHPRLTAQEGAFICYPLPESAESLTPIDKLVENAPIDTADLEFHKLLIPAKYKSLFRHEISRLGARHSLMFPDLDGVAREIALRLHETCKRRDA